MSAPLCRAVTYLQLEPPAAALFSRFCVSFRGPIVARSRGFVPGFRGISSLRFAPVRYSTVPPLRPSHSLSISPPERQTKTGDRGVSVMRVFIIDTSNMGPELQGGLIGVVGEAAPTADEKQRCIETISRYANDGWAIAADPLTPIGRLAAMTAESACVPFVHFGGARLSWTTVSTIVFRRGLDRDSADPSRSPFPAQTPVSRDRVLGPNGTRGENGGRLS